MRAALMERGRIWVDEVPDPVPGAGEVLVKTAACGICGSDLHAAIHTEDFVATSREVGGAFKLTSFDPVVLGHEFCAEVVDYGPNCRRTLPVGQLVCSLPVLLGEELLALGYSTRAPGGFGEYMRLSERLLLPVPDGTPAQAAALTEPMAVGYHAVNKARLSGAETTLVLGSGPVGLAVITALKAAGIGPIVASDLSSGRRQFALGQGATCVVDPAREDPFGVADVRAAKDLVVFECVGVPGMLDQVFVGAPQNARIVVVGVCLQTDHARPLIAINKELNVQYVLGYSPEEFTESLHLISDGKFDIGGLITAEVGLEGVSDAFVALGSPEKHAKVLVVPGL